MFNLGAQELVMIFLIIMVLFGAKRLPDIGKGLGRGIREFKRATELADEDDHETTVAKRDLSHPDHDANVETPLKPIQ